MEKLKIIFNDLSQFFLSTGKEYRYDGFAYSNSCVSMDADTEVQHKSAMIFKGSEVLDCGATETAENGFTVNYKIEPKNSDLKINVRTFEDLNLVFQNSSVVNNDDEEHILTQLTAANVNGVCYDDGESISDRLADGSIIIHFAHSKWQGEGQWRQATPEDLGIYPTSTHPWERTVFRLDSVSSWNTSAFYPMVIIEDKKKNESWFFDVLTGTSWFIEIYSCCGKSSKFLSVKMGSADERLGFAKVLKQGETYVSADAVYGVVKGTFEDAVKELTKFRRRNSAVHNGIPLTFNDYMCCNWGVESNDRLLPLIDKAAELGVEYFCIDDGWQTEQGVWKNADEKFGDLGVAGVLKYITDKGMKPGVWFEFENVPYKLKDEIGGDEAFLFRNDRLVAPYRAFGNFRSEKLRNYLFEKVDNVYKMGVRFIKNDHNNNESVGTTLYGECPAEGLRKNHRAFLDFIDELYVRYPDLIIEHCSSGSNRSDGDTLKHFSVISSSDQENYYEYCSILAGSEALVQPEKCGIWGYPYPLPHKYLDDHILPKELKASFADGEQTVFNMVNASMGGMYLSGRIDQMDDFNFSLMKEGADLFKKRQNFISNSYPIYPKGMIRMSNRTDYAFGLINDEKTEIQLAVWNLSDEKRTVEVDLKKYGLSSCEMIYPRDFGGASFGFDGKKLVVNFEKGKSGRLFRISK